jgi:predicted nucleotidyltransferase
MALTTVSPGAVRAAITRFRASCAGDDAVVAAFLGGSHASGSSDEVSDLDLYVVVREDASSEFFARREEFMRSWSDPLVLEDVVDFEGLGFDMLVFILRDGVWGELALAHTGNVMQTHGGPYEVLVDKVGLLAGVVFPLYVPSRDERRAQMERAFGWFWIDLLNLNKLLVRERRVSAAEYLAKLRAHCLSLLQAAEASDVDLELSALLERLIATTRCADLDDMRAAAGELAELHRVIGRALAPTIDVAYPDRVADLLAETLDQTPPQ